MQFHEITAKDGIWARPRLESAGFYSCEFAFANVYMWSHVYGTEIADYLDFVVARNVGHTHHHFLYPVGGNDLEAVIDACLKEAQEGGKRPMFYSIPESELGKIEEIFPGKFTFWEYRDDEDYLYAAADLRDLPGKSFQKKRNHISGLARITRSIGLSRSLRKICLRCGSSTTAGARCTAAMRTRGSCGSTGRSRWCLTTISSSVWSAA